MNNSNEGRDQDINTIKIVVVGESGVGKTNIISRYIHDKFTISGANTIGSEIDNKKIIIDGVQILLRIWDTAGQQRFRSINKVFYHGAKGALVIFDLSDRKTFQSLHKWVQQLKASIEQNYVLLLVGNKCDIKDQKVTVEEATQYARSQCMGYIQTSAALNKNVAQAFNILTQKIFKTQQLQNQKIKPNKMKSIIITNNENQKKKQKKCCQ